MKINHNRDTISFHDLSEGEVFLYRDEFYLKIDEMEVSSSSMTNRVVINAVSLKYNKLGSIQPNAQVQAVKAELNIS